MGPGSWYHNDRGLVMSAPVSALDRLRRGGAWLVRRWQGLALVLVFVWASPWFPDLQSANELPRAYLTMAMVDEGRVSIDTGVRRWGTTSDVSQARLVTGRVTLRGGRVAIADPPPSATCGTRPPPPTPGAPPIRKGPHYSNKAPGSSIAAIPGYVALRGWHAVVGGAPTLAEVVWVSRLTTGVLPALLLLWALWRFLGRFEPSVPARRLALLGFGVGSMFFLYSVLLFSHPLSAACVAGAWLCAVDACDDPARWRRLGLAGFLAGAAPLVDYQAVFAAVPVAAWVVVRLARWPRGAALRAVAVAALGAAVPIAALLAYHAAAFGGPFVTGYDASDSYACHHQQGFLGMDTLRWAAFVGSTVAPDNGLLAMWPMAALAVPGWVLMARRPVLRGHLAVTLAVAVIYLLFISAINFWRGGWQVGPRYVMAMLPFLLPPIVVALGAAERWWWLRAAAAGLCLVGLVTYTLTTAVFPYFPDHSFVSPVHEITLRMLGEGHAGANLGERLGLPGAWSLLPMGLAALALAAAAVVPPGAPPRRAAAAMNVALGVSAAFVLALGQAGTGGRAAERTYQKLVRHHAEPPLVR
jgi:hypothetical protein